VQSCRRIMQLHTALRLEALHAMAKNTWGARDEFFRHSAIMFIGSMIACVCNYLYQVYLGRALGPEEYGAFGALFSIYYIIYIFSGTIQASSAMFISKYNAMGDINTIRAILLGLMKRATILGTAGFFLFLIFSTWIANFLNIQATESVIILGTIVIFSLLLPISLGALQGLQMFKSLSLISVLTFLPKLLLGIAFVSLGYGISGAIGAVTLALAIAFLSSLILLRSYLGNNKLNYIFNFESYYYYSIPAVIVMICLAVPSNVDVILSKHFFTNFDAGLYAAAAVIGKIVLFLPSSLYAVMFPKASKMYTLEVKTRHLLNRCLIYSGILSSIAAGLFIVFPRMIVVIFGENYLNAIPIVRLYVALMFFVSLLWVIAQYCLATNKLRYSYILLFFTLVELISMVVSHASPTKIIQVLLVINLVVFIVSYGYVFLSEEGFLRMN
jgi:O-antigen/teichoic acid export membrane protein